MLRGASQGLGRRTWQASLVVASLAVPAAVAAQAKPAAKKTPATAETREAGTLARVKETGAIRLGYRTDARPFSFKDDGGMPALARRDEQVSLDAPAPGPEDHVLDRDRVVVRVDPGPVPVAERRRGVVAKVEPRNLRGRLLGGRGLGRRAAGDRDKEHEGEQATKRHPKTLPGRVARRPPVRTDLSRSSRRETVPPASSVTPPRARALPS